MDIDFKNSSIVFAEALMSSSQKKKSFESLRFLFRRRTGAWRRKGQAANIHRLGSSARAGSDCTHAHTQKKKEKKKGQASTAKEECGLFMSLQYHWTAGLKYIDQNAHTQQRPGRSLLLMSFIVLPLSTITPRGAPADRGADGEALVTPSGRGLVKTRGQTERSMKGADHPPTTAVPIG